MKEPGNLTHLAPDFVSRRGCLAQRQQPQSSCTLRVGRLKARGGGVEAPASLGREAPRNLPAASRLSILLVCRANIQAFHTGSMHDAVIMKTSLQPALVVAGGFAWKTCSHASDARIVLYVAQGVGPFWGHSQEKQFTNVILSTGGHHWEDQRVEWYLRQVAVPAVLPRPARDSHVSRPQADNSRTEPGGTDASGGGGGGRCRPGATASGAREHRVRGASPPACWLCCR